MAAMPEVRDTRVAARARDSVRPPPATNAPSTTLARVDRAAAAVDPPICPDRPGIAPGAAVTTRG
ncbi:hypothetical protein Van01_26460 [Micromonospora andamanensis]|uniref:Uncharacterized protein n=1 Tax=Micromonospora andamanensis TaxID=1287068 RepID=A0ABQ4HUY9_9ACTN|nr:hypothetical protein Van01_26460 [Micromonospora andamanensis]